MRRIIQLFKESVQIINQHFNISVFFLVSSDPLDFILMVICFSFHPLPTSSSPSHRPRDIKQFLIRFLYLQEMFQPSNKTSTDTLPSLCQEVLQGFHQCMLHGAVPHARQRDEEGRESYLSNDIIFKLVVLTLMSTYRLQKAGENRPGCIIFSWKHALGCFVKIMRSLWRWSNCP